MPNAAGKIVFEDVVALMESKPNPMDIGKYMDVLAGGLADLNSRLMTVEYGHLTAAHAISALTDRMVAAEDRVRVLEGDRDEYKKRLVAVETAPAAETKRVDDLDKRVSTVEGAVGSTGFKETKAAPAKPAEPQKAA